jgi:signal transduction histidine kinase
MNNEVKRLRTEITQEQEIILLREEVARLKASLADSSSHVPNSSDINHSFDFVPEGGVTGALLRSIDWTNHPLGPPAGWSSTLKNTLAIIFGSRHPMFLWWGQDLFQFYNDAYLPSFGKGKHPSAMGQRGEECWPEIWPIIWPQIEDVLIKGKASWNEDQLVPIFRNGKLEDVYWTYGYSPVRGAEGQIEGVLVVCTETTSRVLATNELQRSRQDLHDFFIQAPLPMVILEGPNHRVALANPPYVRLVGREVAGKALSEAFPKGEADSFIPLLDAVYKTGVPFIGKELPLQIPDENGATQNLWIDIGYHPFRDGSDKIKGVFALVHDVTHQVLARKEVEQSAARVRHYRDRFNHLADASGIGIWYCDLPFSELNWDDKVKEHFWLPANAKVMIDTFYDRIHPQDREHTRSSIEKSIQSNSRYDIEYRTTNPENEAEIKWIRAMGWTDYSQSETPIRFDGITFDITANKISEQALRESESRQKLLSEKMLQGVVHHRRDGSIISMNPSAQRILGMPSEKLFNPLYGAPGHPNIREDGSLLPEREHPIMLAVESGKPVSGVVLGIYNPHENVYRWIEKDAVPLYRPGESIPYEVFAIFSDITERKEAEETRSQLLILSLMDLEKLKVERSIRETFVATLTHDLRNPLTSAKLCAQLLFRSRDTFEAKEKIAGRVISSIDRAIDMIDDLLDVSRIRAGQSLPMEITPCDLNALLSETLDDLATIHGERFVFKPKKLALQGHWSCKNIRRAVENLLGNAVKYGSPTAPITVLLSQTGEKVQIAVHNEGPVLTSDEQLTVFEPFKRTPSAEAGGKVGWGLGLTLVRGIAKAHGGSVEVQSGQGRGTTFTIELPIDARPSQDLQASSDDL